MVMTSFNVINGIPSSANRMLFRDILREEWHFDGSTISDYAAIEETITNGLSKDGKDAAKRCIEAGVDIEMMNITPLWESFSSEAIINAVKEGLGISFLPEQLVKEKIKTGQVATRHITGEQLIRMNYILWHKNKQLTPSLLEFIQICRELSSSIEVTN